MSDILSMFSDEDIHGSENTDSYKDSGSYSNSESYSDSSSESVNYSDSSGKIFVLSIGGSLLINETSVPNTAFIGKLSEKINSLHDQGFKLVLVVGGGVIARNFIGAAKALGADNYSLDNIGIQATKLNASLIIQAIENSFPKVLSNPVQAKEVLKQNMIPVYSGIIPGLTTDAVAALIAENLKATFVNLTNVDGIFSSDPNNNPDARMFDKLSYNKLLTMMSMQRSKPGQNLVLDLFCCSILKRSEIKAVVLNGNDLDNLSSFLSDIASLAKANSIEIETHSGKEAGIEIQV